MTRYVVYEVFTGDAHEVVTDVTDVIFTCVGSAIDINILVDGGKTHRDGAGTIHGRFVHEGYFEAVLGRPISCFNSCSTAGHATAGEQNVSGNFYCFKIRHIQVPPKLLLYCGQI